MLDHVQDGAVFTCGGFEPARVFNRAQNKPLVRELVHEPLVVLQELAVIRAPNDRPVKLVHQPGIGIGVVREGSQLGLLKVPPQYGELLNITAAGEQGCREPLQRLLELEKLNDLPAGGLPDEGAHLRTDLNQAFVLKLFECLPDRRPAHLELLGKEGLRNNCTRRKLSSQDEPADPVKKTVPVRPFAHYFEILLHT